jgi:hypothetical protein
LISGATDPEKAALYSALPSPSVSTDNGATTTMFAASAALRAIGEIPPTANPALEPNFGNPPSIGFNSAFEFDFDPSNGIDANKIDFDAVAVHEIGHVLGFTSLVGQREVATFPLAVTVWDLFRFRPGITVDGFTQAQRVLSSGGEQIFFAGGQPLSLSTGRPNGTGGDGRQASHWKDDALSGEFIGIMDPTISEGRREVVTANDLVALDAMGYRVDATNLPLGNNPPVVSSVTGALTGNTLALMVGADDRDGDLVQAQVSLLNESSNVLTQFQPIALSNDPSPSRTLNLSITAMAQFPSAFKASVSLTDSRTNRSNERVFDFSVADSGGPNLNNVSYDGSSSMTIKGGPFSGQLQLEINGLVVAPPLRIKVKGGGSKLKIGGTSSDLNLRSGPNRIRIVSDGLHSKIVLLSL